MKLQSSVDWVTIESDLNSKCRHISHCDHTHCDQVRKMIKNITTEVTLLSKAEVRARQGNKDSALDLRMKINQDIEMVEGYLLLAAMLG